MKDIFFVNQTTKKALCSQEPTECPLALFSLREDSGGAETFSVSFTIVSSTLLLRRRPPAFEAESRGLPPLGLSMALGVSIEVEFPLLNNNNKRKRKKITRLFIE